MVFVSGSSVLKYIFILHSCYWEALYIQAIHWVYYLVKTFGGYVGLYTGGFYIFMPQQVAYVFYIYAVLQQMDGKTVAQAVYAYVFIYFGAQQALL